MDAVTRILWEHDLTYYNPHHGLIGVDEAGRGPLAGPVVAAAIWLKADFFSDKNNPYLQHRITDSKKLSSEKRHVVYDSIMTWKKQNIIDYQISEVEAAIIDEINILQATQRAMEMSLSSLYHYQKNIPILIDGKALKNCIYPHTSIIKGDQKSLAIALASILAKVHRDKLMQAYDADYPGYGFASHKGYGTPQHYQALKKLGMCAIHRKTFLKNLHDKDDKNTFIQSMH